MEQPSRNRRLCGLVAGQANIYVARRQGRPHHVTERQASKPSQLWLFTLFATVASCCRGPCSPLTQEQRRKNGHPCCVLKMHILEKKNRATWGPDLHLEVSYVHAISLRVSPDNPTARVLKAKARVYIVIYSVPRCRLQQRQAIRSCSPELANLFTPWPLSRQNISSSSSTVTLSVC